MFIGQRSSDEIAQTECSPARQSADKRRVWRPRIFEDKLGMCISVLEFRHYKNSVAEIQA